MGGRRVKAFSVGERESGRTNPRWISVLLGVGMVAALALSQPAGARSGLSGVDATAGVEASVDGLNLEIPEPFGVLFSSFFCGPLLEAQASLSQFGGLASVFDELLAVFGCDGVPPTPTTQAPGSTTSFPLTTITTVPGGTFPSTLPPSTLPPCSTSTSGTGATVPCNPGTTAPPTSLPPCTTVPSSSTSLFPPTTFPCVPQG